MDEIIGSVKSHIQIPKSVLQGFSTKKQIKNESGFFEKHETVFQMDMQGNIRETDIKEANTQFGYYEDFIEKSVLPKIETAFGDFKAKLVRVFKGTKKNNAEITEEDYNAVKKYCAFCIIRSEDLVNGVQKHSIMKDLIANKPQNMTIYTYLQHPETVDCLFDNLHMHILQNLSDINLILPQSGIVMRKNEESTIKKIFIPISDKICVLLSSEKLEDFVFSMDEKFVDKLNKFAVSQEFTNNYRAIYAKNEQDLVRYKDYLLSLR